MIRGIGARLRRPAPAEQRPPATHDLTRVDYAFTPYNGGLTGSVTSWSAGIGHPKPRKGDYLILRNGEGASRYQVQSVNLCLNVDPPTMWIAQVAFAPRLKG